MGPVKKYWKVGIALLAYLAGMGFLMRHDPQMPLIGACVVGLFVVLIGLWRFPGLMLWAEENAGLMRLLGVIIVVAGPAGIVIAIYLANGEAPSDWASGLVMATVFLGAVIFILPRMKRNRDISKEMIAGAPAPAVEGVGILREVSASFVFLSENLPAFFKVSAPWLLGSLAMNLTALHMVKHPKSEGLGGGEFAFLIFYVFLTAFALPAVAVAWHRYVMRAELPAWGVVPPNKRFWRYFYRLWLFGLFIGTMDKIVAANIPDIAHFMGAAAAKTIGGGLEDAVLLLAVWGSGMYALVLPAVAIDDHEVDITVALRLIWPRRLQFATGFLATVLIFYLAMLALGLVQDRLPNGYDTLSVALGVFAFALVLGAVATSATYLSRAYVRAKTQPLAA